MRNKLTRPKVRQLLSLFSFFGILLTGVSTPERLRAETPHEVEKVATEIQKNRNSIVEKDQEKRRILGSLYEISRRMKKITQEKSEMTDKLMRTQDKVKFIAHDIASLEKKIEDEQKKLGVSLRNLYKISGETYLAILFSQDSAFSIDRSLKFLKIVSEKDFTLIKSYKKNVLELKLKKIDLNAQVKKLIHLEEDIKSQESLLLSEQRQKYKIVSEIEAKSLANIEKIKKLRTKAQEKLLPSFDAALSDMLKTAFYENKGQLPAPLSGNVIQDFGLIKSEQYPVELSHKGWLYSSEKPVAVSAIFDGEIAFAGQIDGYGETLIIDHGDHYYSLYASLSQVKVKRGDVVKKSQNIAYAGSTSRPNNVGIYFEIRHFSEPENPKYWISPQDTKVSLSNLKSQIN